MSIGRIDINEKDLPKICGAVIQLEERSDEVEDDIAAIEGEIAAIGSSGGGIGSSPGGRLTLQTLTPVMTTTQSAKTTIYYTPYNGSTVPIYGGTNFTGTAFSELSVATTDTTKSPAAIGASKVNDWFVWSDSGTLRLGHGPDWTSDTVRSAGTALVMVNGILLNNASITNGPAASRGTYVGTTRSNGSSQLDWIYGTTSVGGGEGVFGVWNCYNRVNVSTIVLDSTASWSYNSATVHQANGSNGNRVSFVTGLAEDSVFAVYVDTATSGADWSIGIGLDSTSTFSGVGAYTNILTAICQIANHAVVVLGFHFLQALENTPTVSGGGASFLGYNFPFFGQGLTVNLRI